MKLFFIGCQSSDCFFLFAEVELELRILISKLIDIFIHDPDLFGILSKPFLLFFVLLASCSDLFLQGDDVLVKQFYLL